MFFSSIPVNNLHVTTVYWPGLDRDDLAMNLHASVAELGLGSQRIWIAYLRISQDGFRMFRFYVLWDPY